ncbi:MAG: hypothetical protein NTU49_04525 [Gammaproteobacteria bacterium]|nr:hypothetical protein [Gammaproteobacteria bacterium]
MEKEQRATMSALLPAVIGSVIYTFLDPNSLEGAQGRAAIAKQYDNCLDIDEDYLAAQFAAHENFLKEQKCIENVLAYLLKNHLTLLGNNLQFRYVKLEALSLSNPVADADGIYTIDLTGADYASLKKCFSAPMISDKNCIFITGFFASIALLFTLLFAFCERIIRFLISAQKNILIVHRPRF